MTNEQIVYDYQGFNEYRSQVRLIDGEYKCYTIPEYGGDWIYERTFDTKEKAIEWLEALT